MQFWRRGRGLEEGLVRLALSVAALGQDFVLAVAEEDCAALGRCDAHPDKDMQADEARVSG
jgi:hypothetical protein